MFSLFWLDGYFTSEKKKNISLIPPPPKKGSFAGSLE